MLRAICAKRRCENSVNNLNRGNATRVGIHRARLTHSTRQIIRSGMVRFASQEGKEQFLSGGLVARCAMGLERNEDRINLSKLIGIIHLQDPALVAFIVRIENAETLCRLRICLTLTPSSRRNTSHRPASFRPSHRRRRSGISLRYRTRGRRPSCCSSSIAIINVDDVQAARRHQVRNVAPHGEKLAVLRKTGRFCVHLLFQHPHFSARGGQLTFRLFARRARLLEFSPFRHQFL